MRLASGSLRPGEAALAADPAFAQARFLDFPEAPTLPGEDLESYLRRIGVSEAAIAYLARGWAHAEGEALHGIDAQSAVEQFADTSNGEGNWRILNGYARLIEHVAQGLDIRLGVEIQCIDWSEPVVRVVAADGTTYSADHVIITLPLGVLQAGRVQFVPALPAAKQDAIDRLTSAPVIKLVYRFAEPVLPAGVFALIVPDNPCVWWSPSVAQPTDDVVLTAFVTGDRAREMLALGETAALEKGVEALRAELNLPTLRPLAARMVNWVEDPYTLMGYSITPPGAISAHAALAEPIANRLFWAGEATAGHLWKATVHGAYASGCRAAAEALSAHSPIRKQHEV